MGNLVSTAEVAAHMLHHRMSVGSFSLFKTSVTYLLTFAHISNLPWEPHGSLHSRQY